MTVDSIISNLEAMAMALTLLAHVVPGGAYLTTAAAAISAMAANRELVQKVFDGVNTLADLAKTLLAWMKDNGHGMATRYLRTIGPE